MARSGEVPQQSWRKIAAAQGGLLTRAQLAGAGVNRWAVAHRIASERWQEVTPTVVATTTGQLTREQLMWAGVLHSGPGSIVGALSAAEVHGLRNWHREDITILVPYGDDVPAAVPGIRYVRSRRHLPAMRCRDRALPCALLEPAILLFAAADRSSRTAQGVLAAAVQQRLTTPELLSAWLERLRPLPKAPLLRTAIAEMAGGAQSLAEIDVKRMCRAYGIVPPARQTKRRGADGRPRYTDCEWRRPDGRTIVLEIDGAFHMDVEEWEDDLARQRALSSPDRIIVRCTARELRDEPGRVARDLQALGVPSSAL